LTVSGLNVVSTDASPITVATSTSLQLTLIGENTLTAPRLYAGIAVPKSAALTIGGAGTLSAVGGEYSAGIGANCVSYGRAHSGSITINSGTVTAKGGNYGAGIGGGHNGNSESVTINGGTVTAESGYNGAGIGGGNQGNGGTITINGGVVTAESDDRGAGIGGGSSGRGGIVTISGGTVYAYGSRGGAGIGGGDGNGGSITTISGGTVTAEGGHEGGAGIGGGRGGAGESVTISGGTVIATGGGKSAGIGGGEGPSYTNGMPTEVGGTVAISNAEVTATGYYCAIGGGANYIEFGCTDITMDKTAVVHLSYTNSKNGVNCLEQIDIRTRPVDSAGKIGNSAAFSVDAYGHSGLSYQWQISSDGTTWTDVAGQTAATAAIPVTAENNGYQVRCQLTNGWGNIAYTADYSNTAKLYELAFSKQPADVSALVGGTPSLDVASTCQQVTYQWERSVDDGDTWNSINGETYNTLVLAGATLSDNGLYRCVITASNGDRLASDAAGITITDPNAPATYTVEYYQQNVDGNSYIKVDQEILPGNGGETVTAGQKTYTGFTENTQLGTHSGVVSVTTPLVLSRYYDRSFYTIEFESNGGTPVANLSVRYGAPVSMPSNPTRVGYTFDGWYADEGLTQAYIAGTMPAENVRVYAKWAAVGADRGIEYEITGISLRDGRFQPISQIPVGMFYAEVSVRNISSTSVDTVMLAAYDAGGKMLSLQYLYANPEIGQTFVLGTSVDNTAGSIAKFKAFVVPVLGGVVPLANSVEYPYN